jgi:hypothetical protein
MNQAVSNFKSIFKFSAITSKLFLSYLFFSVCILPFFVILFKGFKSKDLTILPDIVHLYDFAIKMNPRFIIFENNQNFPFYL